MLTQPRQNGEVECTSCAARSVSSARLTIINGPERDKAVAGNALFFETLFTAEIEQVDNERSVSYFTTQTTDQFNGRFDSAAGCQQIVHHQNFVARFDGINVDFQLIGAVFRS